MGYSGKLEEKYKAQQLRKQGFSYKEILQTILVSKDTLSRWCKDIELTETQKYRLINNKTLGQKKGSIVAAENKKHKRIAQLEIIREKARIEIGNLCHRDIFLAGIVLYAAEGDKTDGKGRFANADPKIIKFMANWLTNFVKIPKKKLKGVIYLYDNLDEELAKNYWSSLTHIPLSQFRKTYFVTKPLSKKVFRKNLHPYGVFSIRFSDSAIHRQIMGWIYAMFDAKINL